MNDPHDPDDEADADPIDALAEEFVARHRAGDSPSVEEYQANHPDLAEDIADLFPTLLLMEGLKVPSGSASSGLPIAGKWDIETIGDFHVVREIGRGGMGIVLEAVQESLDRRVALKVLPTGLTSPQKIERFYREARAAARLHHTNIVPVYGVGHDDSIHYFVMQYIDGRGLDEVIAAGREGDARDAWRGERSYFHAAARWIAQAADAVESAHRAGTLHRDIKPANLLLDATSKVWITDFGLAKVELDDDLTEAGSIVGTLRFLAPEQLRGESSPSSDIYGLGATLYELLAGGPAFGSTDRVQLLDHIARRSPTPLRKVDPSIPRDLETIVSKAMEKDATARYRSAGDLADDLRAFLEDRPIRARPIGAAERLSRWCRRNPLIAGSMSVTLVAIVTAAIIGWWSFAQTREAFLRESGLKQEALAAGKTAQRNAELSLAALERIFESLAGDGGELHDDPLGERGPQDARPLWPGRDRGRVRDPRRGPGPEARGGIGGPGRRDEGRADRDAAVLAAILEFYDRFAAENETNANMQLEAARSYFRVSRVHARLGRTEEQRQAEAKGVELFRALRREHPSEPIYGYEFARALMNASSDDSSRLDEATGIVQDLAPGPGLRAERIIELRAALHQRRGFRALEENRTRAAVDEFSDAVDLWTEWAEHEKSGTTPSWPVIEAHCLLAEAHWLAGDHDLAEREWLDTLRDAQERRGALLHPERELLRRRAANAHDTLDAAGRSEAAAELRAHFPFLSH